MNSTWKLLPAGLLVAALAGCGGGGGGEMMEPEPDPTPEEQCSAAGNIWDDGECKTAEDLRKRARKRKATGATRRMPRNRMRRMLQQPKRWPRTLSES